MFCQPGQIPTTGRGFHGSYTALTAYHTGALQDRYHRTILEPDQGNAGNAIRKLTRILRRDGGDIITRLWETRKKRSSPTTFLQKKNHFLKYYCYLCSDKPK